MYPVIFRIGDFEVTSFGILVAVAALVGIRVFARELNRSALPSKGDAIQAPPSTLLERVRGEFLEMPRLRLTPAQAARLWSVSDPMARGLLMALAEARFLVRHQDGSYGRWPN